MQPVPQGRDESGEGKGIRLRNGEIRVSVYSDADPAPEQSLCFTIDAAGKTRQEVLSEAILHTYDIREDSDRLRKSPDCFEKLRGDYQVRREFEAFTVKINGAPAETVATLERLGFKITQ